MTQTAAIKDGGAVNENPMVVARTLDNHRVPLHAWGAETVGGTFINHDGIQGGPSLTLSAKHRFPPGPSGVAVVWRCAVDEIGWGSVAPAT